MTITIRSPFLDMVTYILLSELAMCNAEQMSLTVAGEMKIEQTTDTMYPDWIHWLGDATGCGLITGNKIERS